MTQKKQLGDLLVEAGIITVKTLERALSRQTGSGKRLGMVLEEMGVLTDEEL
ncbi:MAG TPA: two-component system response regulator, partial [Geobacteraceae bacterium]|nr:two-component system response regulator [Geobacteraceae bacterium]